MHNCLAAAWKDGLFVCGLVCLILSCLSLLSRAHLAHISIGSLSEQVLVFPGAEIYYKMF